MMHTSPPHIRWLSRLSTVAVLAGLIVAAPPNLADAAATTNDYVFTGGGWGHSTGMMQYGAYSMAKTDGWTYDQILSRYYSGTSSGFLGVDVPDPGPLWVNLAQERTAVELFNQSLNSGGDVTFTRGSETLALGKSEAATVTATGTDSCTVDAPGGSLAEGSCAIDVEWDGWEAEPTTSVRLVRSVLLGNSGWSTCSHVDWNAAGSPQKPCWYARGTLHIRPDNDSASFNVVVEVAADDYVLGISEMPYYWGDPENGGLEALKAQAVAARSYAVHRAVDRGDPAARPWCWCQVYDSTLDQRYVGFGHGLDPWIEAANATAMEVWTHPDEVDADGNLVPIEAFYSSSSGGWTENNEESLGGSPVPYLRGVDDHWSLDPAVNNGNASWTVSYTPAELAAELGMDPGVGVTNAIIVERSPTPGSAAAARVQFQGSPDKTLTARDLDAALGLKSQQIFSIEVPGTVDPPAASGPLVHSSHLVDDGVNGDSVGNGDGYAQCGETIELYVDLRNTGTGTLSGINAVLVIDSPNLDLLYNAGSDFPDAAPGSSVASIDDWDLAVDPDIVGNPVVELQLIVSATGAGSWFETFTMQIFCGGFADIAGSGFATEIDWLADQGITQGCNPPENSLFCPGEDVTRAQMATFLTRALDLPAAAESQFTDVAGSVHAASIESLREAGITSGCNPPANDRFCPTDNVTRAQMATFLSRALGLAPSDDDGPFTDHTVSVHRRAINAIRIAGITSGCNPPANDHYCPGDNVTRAQMAAFLYRALAGG